MYAAITNNGLKAYYDKRERPSPKATSVATSYTHFETEAFEKLHVTSTESRGGTLRRVQFVLPTIHCAACVWLLERLPTLVPGVIEARVNYAEGRLSVRWDPEATSAGVIARQLHELGYPPHAVGDTEVNRTLVAADRLLLTKLGVAGATFGNVMLLTFALYSGDNLFTTAGERMSDTFAQFFRHAALVLSVPSVLWCSSGFFRGGVNALKTKTPHMDLPISIGIAAALTWGVYSTLKGSGHIYFDTVTMLVFLLLAGRWLQTRQQRAARTATDLMFALAPSSCRTIEAGEAREVPTASVKTGDLIELRAGERVSIDGVVETGDSSVDESLLTGESHPKQVQTGARVHAGTLNLSGVLRVRAESTGQETRLAGLVRQVELASTRRARIAVIAERASGTFTVAVLALSALTFLFWLPWSFDQATQNAVAVLIVTCPCALGLATPLAGAVALTRLARAGVLVKGMSYLEHLASPGRFIIDKTGTLTQGQLGLVRGAEDRELMAMVHCAEQGSAHPVARAIAKEMVGCSDFGWRLDKFEESRGLGVSAELHRPAEGGNESRTLRVGSKRFVSQFSSELKFDEALEESMISRGLSPVYVVVDGCLRAALGFGDPVRPEAAECLSALALSGHQLVLLSGDRTELVKQVAFDLRNTVDGTPLFQEALGDQTPEQKLSYVEDATSRGLVFMLGDGANDAGALAASSVGIAVSGGAEASLAAADAFATRSGLRPIVDLVRASETTLGVIRRNLGVSLMYNLVAVGFAVSGHISPIIAAILMPLSSLTVAFSSLGSGRPAQSEPSRLYPSLKLSEKVA